MTESSPDPRLSELLEKLIENWRRAESVERAEALHADQRGRDLFEQSADTYQICADELAAVLLGGTPQPQEQETNHDENDRLVSAGGAVPRGDDRRTNAKPKSRAYAPGTHWTQRPENKARLRAIRARQRR